LRIDAKEKTGNESKKLNPPYIEKSTTDCARTRLSELERSEIATKKNKNKKESGEV
jgi:hypothetical protein